MSAPVRGAHAPSQGAYSRPSDRAEVSGCERGDVTRAVDRAYKRLCSEDAEPVTGWVSVEELDCAPTPEPGQQLSEWGREQALELRLKGRTPPTIAMELGVTEAAVESALLEAGVIVPGDPPARRRTKKAAARPLPQKKEEAPVAFTKDIDIAKALRRRSEGLSWTKVAGELGVTPVTLRKKIRAAGHEMDQFPQGEPALCAVPWAAAQNEDPEGWDAIVVSDEEEAAEPSGDAPGAAPAPADPAAAALPELSAESLDQVLRSVEIPAELPRDPEAREWWGRLGFLARLADWQRTSGRAAGPGLRRSFDRELRERPHTPLAWARQRLVWLLEGGAAQDGEAVSPRPGGPSQAEEKQAAAVKIDQPPPRPAESQGQSVGLKEDPEPTKATGPRLNGAHPPSTPRPRVAGHDVRGLEVAVDEAQIPDAYTRLLELHNLILRAELGRGSLAEAEHLCAALVDEARP